MKNNFIMFCKTYNKDVSHFKVLKDSVDKFNIDKIPLYVSCPKEDLPLFQKLITGNEKYEIILLSDENIYENIRNYPGYINQQLVKMNFYKLNIAEFYLIIDADSYFIKPFCKTDFMFNETTPYIVMHEGKDAKLINSALGKAGIYEFEKKVQDFFKRNGKHYRFLTTPIVFSTRVLEQLANIYEFEYLLDIVPSEVIWHGEFLLHTECISYKQSEPFFKCMVYNKAYQMYAKVLKISEKDIADIYLGIVMQSTMGGELKYKHKKSLFSRIFKKGNKKC